MVVLLNPFLSHIPLLLHRAPASLASMLLLGHTGLSSSPRSVPAVPPPGACRFLIPLESAHGPEIADYHANAVASHSRNVFPGRFGSQKLEITVLAGLAPSSGFREESFSASSSFCPGIPWLVATSQPLPPPSQPSLSRVCVTFPHRTCPLTTLP